MNGTNRSDVMFHFMENRRELLQELVQEEEKGYGVSHSLRIVCRMFEDFSE